MPRPDPTRRSRADPEDAFAKERAEIEAARRGQEPSLEMIEVAVEDLHPDRVFLQTGRTTTRRKTGGLSLSWTFTSLRGRHPDQAEFDHQDRRQLLAVHVCWDSRRPHLQLRTEEADEDPYGRA